MFEAKYKVRMPDTDMAGVIFFAHQYRFIHEAIEDYFETIGMPYNKLFNDNPFVFVVVHSEADYYHPLAVGDILTIELSLENIGTTSFTAHFSLKRDDLLVGTAKTVHVCLDRITREKTPIPPEFKLKLK